jgi:putative membrane protein (TIGR04086 family)
MNYNRAEYPSFSYVAVAKGVIVCLLTIILATIILGGFTDAGWTGMLYWSDGGYLALVYLSLTAGAISAGVFSRSSGWVVGLGVGLLTSIFFLINAWLAGENVNLMLFIAKTFINCFIGAFGGIIGINISKK